jgi:hypothetical protein
MRFSAGMRCLQGLDHDHNNDDPHVIQRLFLAGDSISPTYFKLILLKRDLEI